MSSSPVPAGADQLSRLDAARLHACRFDKPLLSSILTLAVADQLITHHDGGVLAITRLGRPWPRVLATSLAYLGLAIATAVAAANGRYAIAAASALALLTVILVGAPKAARKLRQTRRHDVRDLPTWLITDISTEPHRRLGHQLMQETIRLADTAGARLVLESRPDNLIALRLYERHGFSVQPAARNQLLLHRPQPTRNAG
jgi:GNAT superfamily N-acetyltransferase